VLRVSAAVLALIFLIVGIPNVRGGRSQHFAWTLVILGVLLGLYAARGKTGVRSFDE
jgi:hypothetical protein